MALGQSTGRRVTCFHHSEHPLSGKAGSGMLCVVGTLTVSSCGTAWLPAQEQGARLQCSDLASARITGVHSESLKLPSSVAGKPGSLE